MAKNTVLTLAKQASEGKKVTMVTSYDYTMASIVEAAGINMILVGDSLGMTMLGYEDTIPVTMDDMVHHTRAVTRATSDTFVVGDMPFMSYQASVEEALHNAGRLMKEGRCNAVKLEGGVRCAPQIHAIVEAGIPVVGHVGMTPQSANSFGGFKVQGKSAENAQRIWSTTRLPSRPRAPSPSCSSASRATSRSSSRASSPTASPSASAPAPRATARCSSRRTSSA